MSKGDWQGGDRAVPLHLPEPAQAWEDESRLSHQAVHELKMLTTMLLKSTETLGSLGRVAVDHVSRADSSYGMRTRTRRPMHSRGSPDGALASAGQKNEKKSFPSCESRLAPLLYHFRPYRARGSGEGGRARFNIHTQIHRSLGSFAHERECDNV